MTDLKRVFYHELGHFVANELNLPFGGLGTESIILLLSDKANSKYSGETEPIKPEGYVKAMPSKEWLVKTLLGYVYGCIFESYYLSSELMHCFATNGHDVCSQWSSILGAHSISHYNKELSRIDLMQFKLFKEKKVLEDFMLLDPTKYLGKNGDEHYYVNLDDLRNDTKQLIDNFRTFYYEHHAQYKNVVDNAVSWSPGISES